MRKTKLLSATALSLVLTGLASTGLATHAFADTSIASAITNTTNTSTAGNTTVTSAGTITLTSGAAITVDSDNTVEVDGPISMSSSADNSTGVLITPGRTSSVVVSSTITVTDNYAASDTSSPADGIADAPWATGTGRYGIHSQAGAAFNGNVSLSGGTIDVEGNNSYGIRFENNLNGTFTDNGATVLIGDNGKAISLEGGATGNVYLGGSVNVLGQGSTAVNFGGNYGGNILFGGTISGTGYGTTAGLTAAQVSALTANDLEQDGALVTISGNVANGILFTKIPTIDSTNTSIDQDGDGITDTLETTATLTQYGAAPALVIGSSASDITIGGLTYNSSAISPPSVNYGLLVRGSIASAGTYAGVSSTAVQIGGFGHNVTIANGIGVVGSLSSSALTADSTALSLQSGAITPQLDINGSVTASLTSTTAVGSARAIDIAAGASLPTINILTGGSLAASATGSLANATAIRDQSNTLTKVTNNGSINVNLTATDNNGDGVLDTVVNRPIAIDTRNNTVGLTLTQTDLSPTDTTVVAPSIFGDIYLGSGNDTIQLNNGLITGNIDFGLGANVFNIAANTVYLGRLTGSGTVAMDVEGVAQVTAGTLLNLTNLHVGSTGGLDFTANLQTPTTPIFVVNGAAVFDNGAAFGIGPSGIIKTPTTFTLLTAASINLGNINITDLTGKVPYLYEATLSTNSTNTTLFANMRLRTQAEAGYSNNEYNALIPILTAASSDAGGTEALLGADDKASFDAVYEQYLPDYSGESLISLSKSGEGINHTLANLTLIPDNQDGQYWLQEYGFQTTRKYGDTAGFKSTGFSFAGGREQAVGPHNMLGVYIDYTSATPVDTFAIANEQLVASDLTIGGYWRVNDGGFKAWAHAGAGYTQFDSTRELLSTYVTHIAKARWSGYSYSAGAGASYGLKWGVLNITPQILGNFYDLNEAKHTETGGTDYFDLAIAARNGSLLTSKAMINVSYNKWFVKPELWVGYKDNVSASIANTVAAFPGGTPFTLTGGNIKGGGPVAGFRFSTDNQYSYFSLEGEYEKLNAVTDYSLSLRTRFQF